MKYSLSSAKYSSREAVHDGGAPLNFARYSSSLTASGLDLSKSLKALIQLRSGCGGLASRLIVTFGQIDLDRTVLDGTVELVIAGADESQTEGTVNLPD
jgi:hypothetical protein